jgi:Sugar (and other) transporter
MLKAWAWGTYIFFAVFLAGGIVWVWLCLPETKGATLEEMDRVFKSKTGEADAILLAEARRDVGLDEATLDNAEVAAASEKGSEKDDLKGSNSGTCVEVV